jgi:hypothetical protein
LLLVWTALLISWDCGATLSERFDSARAAVTEMFPSLKRVGRTYQGFIGALMLAGASLLDSLADELRRQMRAMQSCWTIMGILAFAVDGSRVECPRTAANEAQLKRAGRKKTGPQLSLTTVYHMASGCPWDCRIGPGIDSERTHLRDMISTLPPEAMIVADAGFIGYDLLWDILAGGRHILFRVGSNVTLLKGLGYAKVQDDSTVYLWPQNAQHQNRPPIVLRLIVLGGGRHPAYVVTDMMTQELLSNEQAGVLYRLRWGIEVFYRSLKRTLGHHKMRCGAPQKARMELAWAFMGLWVLSVLGAGALIAKGMRPQGLSIALARKQVRQAMAGRTRPGSDLRRQLATALKDTYARKSSKAARDWPHKKTERPPGPPKTQTAKPRQVLRAKELLETNIAA